MLYHIIIFLLLNTKLVGLLFANLNMCSSFQNQPHTEQNVV